MRRVSCVLAITALVACDSAPQPTQLPLAPDGLASLANENQNAVLFPKTANP